MYNIFSEYSTLIEKLSSIKSCDYKYLYDLINKVISSYGNNIKTYILEEYIESEWLDMHSVYYGKLRKSISNKTIRLHIVFEEIKAINEINENNYYGYLTIRPTCRGPVSVSRIRLKYDKNYYKSDNLFVIDYASKVHFPHTEIRYTSFPFFRQDGMVTVCAHADMHMLIKTMHNVHGFNKYGLANILNRINNSEGRDIPNEGLSLHDIVSALKRRDFNPMITAFTNAEYILDNDKVEYSIFEFLDTMIESQLPVILAFDSHVIIIAGVSMDDEGFVDKYIVFDDSGYHIGQVGFNDKYPNHTRLIDKEKLHTLISSDKVKKNCLAIVPTYKSLFFRYRHLNKRLKELMSAFDVADGELDYRVVLVNSKRLKMHLYEQDLYDYNSVLLPHYVWYIEFYGYDGIVKVCIVDAMAHQHSEDVPIIASGKSEKITSVENSMQKLILLKEIV